MKLKICLMGLLCLFFRVSAQDNIKPKGLNVGDMMPDITLTDMLNYPGGTVKFADLKNKVVILDFWATWCGSCISHFPEMYAIQKKFKNEVQVLLISQRKNRDTRPGIIDFFNKHKNEYQFACAVQDTVLDRLFIHSTIPHCAIIKGGRVAAITNAENITATNIERIIHEPATKLYVKKDVRIKRDKPLFSADNGEMPVNFYRTIITGKIDMIADFNFQTNDAGLVTRIFGVNQMLYLLHYYAYPELAGFPETRILCNIPHPERFIIENPDNSEILRRKFTYESSFPPVKKSEALIIMKSDLKRYFCLSLDSQYRDTLCYVLKINPTNPPKTTASRIKWESNIDQKNNIPKYFRESPVDYLRSLLEGRFLIPFVDETHFSANISLDLPANILNADELAVSLKKQGILLTLEKRRISYLVFTQKQEQVQ